MFLLSMMRRFEVSHLLELVCGNIIFFVTFFKSCDGIDLPFFVSCRRLRDYLLHIQMGDES